jgi:hypothetical protein
MLLTLDIRLKVVLKTIGYGEVNSGMVKRNYYFPWRDYTQVQFTSREESG